MIPLVAAIVLAGAAGAGPVLVSDACGGDTTDNGDTKCVVAEVERSMGVRPRPKELKVHASAIEPRPCLISYMFWREFTIVGG